MYGGQFHSDGKKTKERGSFWKTGEQILKKWSPSTDFSSFCSIFGTNSGFSYVDSQNFHNLLKNLWKCLKDAKHEKYFREYKKYLNN